MHPISTIQNTFASVFVIILVFTFVVNVTADEASPKKDKCNAKKVDQCAVELTLFGDENFQNNPPKTLAEISGYCKRNKRLLKCIRDYAENCLKSQSKQMLSIMMYSITRGLKYYCSNNKKKSLMLEMAKCYGKDAKHYKKVVDQANLDLHSVAVYKPANLRIPLLCCSFYRLRGEIVKKMEGVCPNVAPAVDDLFDSYGSDMLNTICGDYTPDSDKCSTVVDKIPPWTKPLEWKAFLMVIVHIFDDVKV